MLTDPANVPRGVSAVYVTYGNLGLHAAGLGQDVWVPLGGQGTLETLGLVNFSQTISSTNVPALQYDQVAFEISDAKVDFHGVNYSATVNGGRLIASIPGGLTITSSKIAAVVVDILPTVLNLGDKATPHLLITAGVKALPVPQSEVSNTMTVLQNRFSLAGHTWSQPLTNVHAGNVSVSGISLTPNSFSFTAVNHGADTVDLKMVVISPVSQAATASAPDVTEALSGSFVFVVLQNGTLQLVHTDDSELSNLVPDNAGYDLAPGATAHFTFSGAITSVAQGIAISKGTPYNVLVLGQAEPIQTVAAN
jgi:hypothetical protein